MVRRQRLMVLASELERLMFCVNYQDRPLGPENVPGTLKLESA
jgi:hypothetical protein